MKLTKQEIFAKANKILEEKRNKDKHIQTCVAANICPECGESLVTKQDKDYNDVTKCSVNKKHYKHIEYYDYDEE